MTSIVVCKENMPQYFYNLHNTLKQKLGNLNILDSWLHAYTMIYVNRYHQN